MDSPSSTAASASASSPGAGSYNIPGDTSPQPTADATADTAVATAASDEESKFKEDEEEIPPSDLNMLIIEDSTLDRVPPHLENLLSSFDVNKTPPADLLIALIYGIALECSFAAIDEVQRNLRHLRHTSYLSTFDSRNVRLLSKLPQNIYDADKMAYILRLQLMFDTNARPCLMTGIVTGDLIILTLTSDCGHGKSNCLSIGRYVLNSKGRPFPSRFRKLPELCYRLRDEVLIPIRNHMIKRNRGILIYPGLGGLPEELYPYLYKYMNKNNLNKTANVSKRLQSTIDYYKKHIFVKEIVKVKNN